MYIPVYVTKYMLLNYRSKRSGYFIFGIGKHKVNLFIYKANPEYFECPI